MNYINDSLPIFNITTPNTNWIMDTSSLDICLKVNVNITSIAHTLSNTTLYSGPLYSKYIFVKLFIVCYCVAPMYGILNSSTVNVTSNNNGTVSLHVQYNVSYFVYISI